MIGVRLVLQVFIVATGLAAAGLWWKASALKSRIVPSIENIVTGDGDLSLRIGPDEVLVWRVSLQNELNAWAAIFAGVSVAMQAVLSVIPAD